MKTIKDIIPEKEIAKTISDVFYKFHNEETSDKHYYASAMWTFWSRIKDTPIKERKSVMEKIIRIVEDIVCLAFMAASIYTFWYLIEMIKQAG